MSGLKTPIKRERALNGFKNKIHQRLWWDKARHYIIIKGSIQTEDKTFVNIYATNKGAHKYIMEILINLKEEIYSTTIIVWNIDTLLHKGIDHPEDDQ